MLLKRPLSSSTTEILFSRIVTVIGSHDIKEHLTPNFFSLNEMAVFL